MDMLEKIKKGILPTIIAISALSVSGSAAFYSVSGLSKLFAGASFEVMLMASSLEVSKLVIASLLYRYWDTINKALRTYLIIAATTLVLITSMGIYGFLSSAYQETASDLGVVDNKKQFIQQKVDYYEKDVARYDSQLESILANINNLSTAKSSQIQVRDTNSETGYRTTVSTTELRMAQKRIVIEEKNREQVQNKRQVAADSLQKFQLQILQLSNSTEQAGELGPLKYISGLTGIPMDKIINILILVIIFVFDPLAIALVIAANFSFEQIREKPIRPLEETMEGMTKVVNKWEDFQDELNIEDWEPALNDGLDYIEEEYPKPNENLKQAVQEYHSLDVNKDGIVDDSEIQLAKNQLSHYWNLLETPLSSLKRRKIQKEIKKLKGFLDTMDEDNTKTY